MSSVPGGIGVWGRSDTGQAVYGLAGGAGTGVEGQANGSQGRGVVGSATASLGRGVYGLTSQATGIGVFAENSGGGNALQVLGKAQLGGSLTVGTTLTVGGTAEIQSAVEVLSTVTAQSFTGSGSGLSGIPASAISSGTFSQARLPINVVKTNSTSTAFIGPISAPSFAGSGGNALRVLGTAQLDGSLTVGTTLKVGGTAEIQSALKVVSTVTAQGFAGDGGGLTNLSALALNSGTVSLARLPATLAHTNAPSTSFAGALAAGKYAGLGGAALNLAGSGVGTVPRREDDARIVNPLCKRSSRVLVTLQSSPGTAVVSYVKPAKGFFDVFLTAEAKSPIKLAYLILA